MTDEIKDALWDAIETKNELLSEAKNHAQEAEYADAARCEAEARGARTAVFAILNNLGDRPPEMVTALERWEG